MAPIKKIHKDLEVKNTFKLLKKSPIPLCVKEQA